MSMFAVHFDPTTHPECNGVFELEPKASAIEELEFSIIRKYLTKKQKTTLQYWIDLLKASPIIDLFYKRNYYFGLFNDREIARETLIRVIQKLADDIRTARKIKDYIDLSMLQKKPKDLLAEEAEIPDLPEEVGPFETEIPGLPGEIGPPSNSENFDWDNYWDYHDNK